MDGVIEHSGFAGWVHSQIQGENSEKSYSTASMRLLEQFSKWCLTSKKELKRYLLGKLTPVNVAKTDTFLSMCSSQFEASLLHTLPVQNAQPGGWRDGSVVKSICCSSEGPVWVSSTLVEWFTTACNSSSVWSDALFWPLWTLHLHPHPIYRHMYRTNLKQKNSLTKGFPWVKEAVSLFYKLKNLTPKVPVQLPTKCSVFFPLRVQQPFLCFPLLG